MKKSLIALAVAGVVAAPAFAATGNVDVYGKVRLALTYLDVPGAGTDGWRFNDMASRIGFKGSEDLGGGMKALWQIESGFNAGGAAAAGAIGSRNSFVGLAGGFGTFLMGRHDTPYKLAGSADLFADTIADSQGGIAANPNGGIIGAYGFDLRVDNALAYITPDYSGFHAAVAFVPGAVAADMDINDAMSLALVYANGPMKVTFGWEDHNNIANETAWKLNGSYTFGDVTVGATYESQDRAGVNTDSDAWLVSAAYGMGPITLAAQYGNRDHDNNATDLERWTVGMIYALSKRTNVAVAYDNDDNNGAEISGVTVQLNHDF